MFTSTQKSDALTEPLRDRVAWLTANRYAISQIQLFPQIPP
ncbi:hypothetical protein [Moorena sp. SIO4A5]|nr:hypothetical protein [Moorena sp. SIO4A5]